jgi:hypothetical protein
MFLQKKMIFFTDHEIVTSWQKELMRDISKQPYKTKKKQNPPMLAGFLYANNHNILWGASR